MILLFLFILCSLIVLKYLVVFFIELFSSEPNRVKLTLKEQITLAVALSYAATYLIY
jgi:hypothetical protein